MIKTIFYLKHGKTDKNGNDPIYARVSFMQDSITMSAGKSISKERWIYTNNLRNPLKIEKEKIIKSSLELFQLNLEKKFLELFRFDPEVSLKLLKAEITQKKKIITKEVTIMEIMLKHNDFFKRKVAAGERAAASLQKYERAADLIHIFMNKQYHIDDLPAQEISSGFVFNLEEYLKFESNFKSVVGIKNNSVVKYMKMYKTACNYGIRMDLISKNPFNVYDGRLHVKDAVFLTQLELDAIEKKKFSIDRLEKVKDIFLFCCYTGYAPIDATKLTIKNLMEDNKGNIWLIANRTKTDTKTNVPLLAPAKKIINKYEGKQLGLIPKISNQKMNSYLKEIADLCGITKHLTWYVSRHTFATTVTLGNGVRIENVSAMMGHTNIRQTQHYAKVLDSNVMFDMKKVVLSHLLYKTERNQKSKNYAANLQNDLNIVVPGLSI